MADPDEPELVIDLRGPQWQALLTVAPPTEPMRQPAEFDVPPLGSSTVGQLQRITADVIYTTATNHRAGWPEWHVKIYRCVNTDEAEILRWYLHRQAVALQQANNYLPGPDRRTAIEPPWAVVPVQVVRGDGRLEQLDGTVATRLGAPPDQILSRLRRTLPPWFGDVRKPELLLLAVSPKIDPLRWDTYKNWPGTEQLPDFTLLAAGLDQMHLLRWAHCDIKPDNVCRYTARSSGGYVLIDTDAATQADPTPLGMRTSDRYMYRRLRDGSRLTPGIVYAQDRFGFLTVVLSALAGRTWVDHTLLYREPQAPGAQRVADSEDSVAAALGSLWSDARWEPLIRVLAEPFGLGPRGQIAIESPGPWAADWLGRVIAAEKECRPAGAPVEPEPVYGEFTPEFETIRADTEQGRAPKLERVREGYRAIDRRAEAVAIRKAVIWTSIWAGGITLAAAIFSFGAFLVGK